MRLMKRSRRLILLLLSLPLLLMVAGVFLQHVILIKKLLMGDAAVFVRSGSVNIVVDGKEKCAKIFRVSDTLTKNIYYKQKNQKMGNPYFMVYLGHGSFMGGANLVWCSGLSLFRTWCATPRDGALYFGRWLVLSSTSLNCTYDVCDEFKGIGCDTVRVEKKDRKLVYKCLKTHGKDESPQVILSLEVPYDDISITE